MNQSAIAYPWWNKKYGDSSPQYGRAIAADRSGNALLTGDFAGVMDFGGGSERVLRSIGLQDIFLAKLHVNSGSLVCPPENPCWSLRFGPNAEDYYSRAYSRAVAVDANGNVTIAGFFMGTIDFGGGPLVSEGGLRDVFVAKFDAFGNHLWSRKFGDVNNQYAQGLALDSSGNIFLVGTFQGAITFAAGDPPPDESWLYSAGGLDIFVAKLDPDGNHLWSRSFGDRDHEEATGVAVDSAGNALVTGNFGSYALAFDDQSLQCAGGSDIFVLKLNGDTGLTQWVRGYGDSNFQYGTKIAVDSASNVLLTGQYQGTVNFGGGNLPSAGQPRVFVAKLNSAGAHVWSKQFGGTQEQYGSDVAVDPFGHVVLTGYFYGSINFGPTPSTTLTSRGSTTTDVYLAKLSRDGAYVWGAQYGDEQDQWGSAVVSTQPGGIETRGLFSTGHFKGTINFGRGPLSYSPFAEDIFVIKFDVICDPM